MMGAVRTLFDGVISISYGQFYLLSDEVPDLTEAHVVDLAVMGAVPDTCPVPAVGSKTVPRVIHPDALR